MTDSPSSTFSLTDKRIAFVTANEGVEQVELTEPWQAVLAAGGTPVHIATEVGKVQAFDHLTAHDVFEATVATAEADASSFDGVVLPGGVANPDQLRTDDHALAFLRQTAGDGTPIAVICHGPWTLIEADLVGGRTLTSWPSLRTDITNAGGSWIDQEVVVCTDGPGTIVSSRNPDDLPAFNEAMVTAFARD